MATIGSVGAEERSRLRRYAAAVTIGFILFGHLLTAIRASRIPAPVHEIVFRGLTFSLACLVICTALYLIIERQPAERFGRLVLIMLPASVAAGVLTAFSLIAVFFVITGGAWHRDTRFGLFLSVANYWTWYFLAWSGTVLALKHGLGGAAADAIPSTPAFLTHLWASDRGTRVRVPVESILHVEASGDYVVLHSRERRHMIHDSLASLTGRLDPAAFMRVHRCALVSLAAVKAIESRPDGSMWLQLDGGSAVRVSRRYRRSVQQLHRNFG